jgi:hypothetical protein
MTATVIPFFHDASFDPEATHIMGQAFECACKSLHDVGQPEMVKNVIAKRIIEIAKTGERDPNQLCKRALKAVRLPPQRS